MNTRVITYNRAELLGIRRASRSFVCGSVLHDLKLNGLLRFRGCRTGRRKISVRISDRISHTTHHDRTTSRTSVLVPIVPEQRFRVGSYLKFCSFNAGSVRNKSADLVSYVGSSGANIFAVIDTWLSEIDDAYRAEITPPGYKLFDHKRFDQSGGGTSLCTDSPDALNDLVKCYNSTLSAALDRHAPGVTKFITVRPWYFGLVKILGSQGGQDGELKENGVDLEVSVICFNLK